MTYSVEAIYEKGALRLKKPVAIPDGTQVEVIVVTREEGVDAKAAAAALASIASLPMEADDKGFSGADHDEVLYGKGAEQ